jgi:hypothetical protein
MSSTPSTLQAIDEYLSVTAELQEAVIRLADEGVPVSAIARALRIGAGVIRQILANAVEAGMIAEISPMDWPVGQARDARTPAINTHVSSIVDDKTIFACLKAFKVTKLQATALALLIRRKEVTKAMIHHVVEQRRPANSEETDPKMVDVVICNLRKRIKPYNLTIVTVWSCGYYMLPEDRLRAAEMIKAAG